MLPIQRPWFSPLDRDLEPMCHIKDPVQANKWINIKKKKNNLYFFKKFLIDVFLVAIIFLATPFSMWGYVGS